VSFTSLSLASRPPRPSLSPLGIYISSSNPLPLRDERHRSLGDFTLEYRGPTIFLIKGMEDEAKVQSSQGLDLGSLLTLSACLNLPR
jgi:hypothetical protein